MALIGGDGRDGRDGRDGGVIRPKNNILKVLVFMVLLVFQVLQVSQNAYGWGSITHSAICRDISGEEDFIMGGIAPDMVSLHAVVTGDHSFDYSHNCYGDARTPVFGNILTEVSSGGFAFGWRAHQLADSVVHGAGGYSTSKTIFRNLPDKYANDINHGAVELIVDAIILDEYYRGDVSLYVPEQAESIHEGAVAFYNRNVDGDLAIPAGNIINCGAAKKMAFDWQNCLQTNIFLASMLAEEPWFSEVRDEFSDYRIPYDRSVALLNGVSARQEDNPSVFRAFVDFTIPPRPVLALDAASASKNNDSYYLFLNEVSKRARVIGGGKATKESTRQAIDEMSLDESVPAEQRVWAEAMAEMTSRRNTDRKELEASISGRLAKGRDGSATGAAGGRRISLLPYLPCSALIFILAAMFVWLLRIRRR